MNNLTSMSLGCKVGLIRCLGLSPINSKTLFLTILTGVRRLLRAFSIANY